MVTINPVELACKVLRVNLTTGSITTETLNEAIVKDFIGGAGVGYRLLYDEVKPDVGAFDPENKIIITTGLATGTTIPATSLFNICTIGPLTGLAVSAQANGFFGARLKQAGYSTLILEGKSDKWTYLVINDGKAELKDAGHLVGKNTFETEKMIKEETGSKKSSVLSIGLGGENLVRYAAIQSDEGHFAASNGPGAVMGSKKLKGIVAFGDFKIEAVNPEAFKEAVKEYAQLLLTAPPAVGLAQLGTGMLIPIAYKLGYLPTKNLSDYEWPANEKYGAGSVKKDPAFEFKRHGCFACTIGHCKDMSFKEGIYKGKIVDEPEYEGWQGFSGLIGVDDVAETAMLNTLNDEHGLDLKEMCYTLAWAIECFEKGYITKEDTDGLELTWGNVAEIKKLMVKVATRDGFGNKLAEGVMRASKMFGGPAADCAVYCKRGAAPHIHDPRGNYSVAFGQMITENASIWGMVNRNSNPELGYDQPLAYTESDFHPMLLARGVPMTAWLDCYMMCNFAGMSLPLMMKSLNALTGWNMNEGDAMAVGSRMANIARAVNIIHGATAADDTLSKRLLDPVVSGPNTGKALGEVVVEAKKKYYKAMGWNEETSYPLPETLKNLKLDFVADALYK